MPRPDPEKFEITCYMAWEGVEATIRLGSKEEHEAVRRALDDLIGARYGGKWEAPAGYYAFEEQDRAAFDEIMRDKGI